MPDPACLKPDLGWTTPNNGTENPANRPEFVLLEQASSQLQPHSALQGVPVQFVRESIGKNRTGSSKKTNIYCWRGQSIARSLAKFSLRDLLATNGDHDSGHYARAIKPAIEDSSNGSLDSFYVLAALPLSFDPDETVNASMNCIRSARDGEDRP